MYKSNPPASLRISSVMAPIQRRSATINNFPQGFPVVDKNVVTKAEPIGLGKVPLNGGILVKTLHSSNNPYLRRLMFEDWPTSYSASFDLVKLSVILVKAHWNTPRRLMLLLI